MMFDVEKECNNYQIKIPEDIIPIPIKIQNRPFHPLLEWANVSESYFARKICLNTAIHLFGNDDITTSDGESFLVAEEYIENGETYDIEEYGELDEEKRCLYLDEEKISLLNKQTVILPVAFRESFFDMVPDIFSSDINNVAFVVKIEMELVHGMKIVIPLYFAATWLIMAFSNSVIAFLKNLKIKTDG